MHCRHSTKKLTVAGVLLLLLHAPMPKARAQGAEPVPIAQKENDLLAGIARAIAYSGYRTGQHPDRGEGAKNPSDAEILEDLQLLVRHQYFGLIRLYDSGQNSRAVLRLIRKHKLPLKVMLGIWLNAEVNNPNCPWLPKPIAENVLAAGKAGNKREVKRGIRLAKKYADIVVAVNVGNESQVSWTDHLVPEDALLDYVHRVKKAIAQPVTTADNYDWWAKHGARVAKTVDFVAVHTYPAWENKTIDEALAYSIRNIQDVRDALPGSRIVIGEAGWATTASQFGARANEAAQKRYVTEMFAWTQSMNITFFLFEAFDEAWKGDPNNRHDAEKHWGIFTADRKPKPVAQELAQPAVQ